MIMWILWKCRYTDQINTLQINLSWQYFWGVLVRLFHYIIKSFCKAHWHDMKYHYIMKNSSKISNVECKTGYQFSELVIIRTVKGFRHVIKWVSEWLLFNANSVIFQLYHGENKLIFNEMMMKSALLDFYGVSSLKQQSTGRHVAPLWHIILIPSRPVFALSP